MVNEDLIQRIQSAFAWREKPALDHLFPHTPPREFTDEEEAEFYAIPRYDLLLDQWDRKYNAVLCFLQPDAYRYYLPAAMVAVLRAEDYDFPFPLISVTDSLANMWNDDFSDYYLQRWIPLTPEELNLVLEWLLFCCDRTTLAEPKQIELYVRVLGELRELIKARANQTAKPVADA